MEFNNQHSNVNHHHHNGGSHLNETINNNGPYPPPINYTPPPVPPHPSANGRRNSKSSQSMAINSTQDTAFDVMLQWCSLACSKLLFHPIEFPIHALTTFIQSNPTAPPHPPSPINTVIDLQQSNKILLSNHQFLPSSESLWKLFKQKGWNVYDGGLVYLAHNMIVIITNFAQRYVSTLYNPQLIQQSRQQSPNTEEFYNTFDNNNNNNHNNNQNRLNQREIEKKKRIGKVLDLLLSLVKNGLTLPLDVLMTRLIVQRSIYKSSNQSLSDCNLTSICKNEGLINGLYAGWEVVVLKSLLEWLFRYLDNTLINSSKRGQFNQNEKSPSQILLLCTKILLDYVLTVIKVRLNIRNIGIVKTITTIFKREGIRGFFSGLNTYFILFPLWMIGILFANVIFVKLKQKLVIKKLPTSPVNSGINSNGQTFTDLEDGSKQSMGVAMTPLTTISVEPLGEYDDDEVLNENQDDDDDDEDEDNESDDQGNDIQDGMGQDQGNNQDINNSGENEDDDQDNGYNIVEEEQQQ